MKVRAALASMEQEVEKLEKENHQLKVKKIKVFKISTIVLII